MVALYRCSAEMPSHGCGLGSGDSGVAGHQGIELCWHKRLTPRTSCTTILTACRRLGHSGKAPTSTIEPLKNTPGTLVD